MIRVRITGMNGAVLEQDLPTNINELHHALLEMGIRKTPRSILLQNDNAAEVELTADSEIGNRLLRVFCKSDTLVNSEGMSYARYAAYLSGARTLSLMDRYPTLRDFCVQMDVLVDKYVQQAI